MNITLNFIILLSMTYEIIGRLSSEEASRIYGWTDNKNMCLHLLPGIIYNKCMMKMNQTGLPVVDISWQSGISTKCCFNKCQIHDMKLTCENNQSNEEYNTRLGEQTASQPNATTITSTTTPTTKTEDLKNIKTEEELCMTIIDAKKHLVPIEFSRFVIHFQCIALLDNIASGG